MSPSFTTTTHGVNSRVHINVFESFNRFIMQKHAQPVYEY